MKSRSVKKWSLIILIGLIAMGVFSCVGIKSQITHHNGGHTEVVDPSTFKAPSTPIAITNASVLSTDCTEMLDSLTVLVKDGKIASVSKEGTIPEEYQQIDATGKYLIPGLIDTHVHLHESKNDLLLYLANGVTSIGEMFGNEDHLKWREDANNGQLSPNIYVATRKVGSKRGLKQKVRSWFGSMKNYSTPNKARRAVRKFKEQGYDAIKLSSFLEPEIYHAITGEAKKQGIPAIGHLSEKVRLEDLYVSGQSQLAHVEEITKKTMQDFGGMNSSNGEAYIKYLNENCDAIAVKIRENNIVVSSTVWLIVNLPNHKFDLDNFIKTIALEYANPGEVEGSKMRRGWLPGNNSYEDLDIKNDPELSELYKIFWNTYAEAYYIMTKALIRNGVTIIAGTDSNTACAVPGFSLHDELASLHKAGLTNAEVLQTATRNAGQWMKNEAGKIEAGSRADLVLLNENPLENIQNTRSINTVISNGKLLDRALLDQILQAIKDANDRSREVSIDEFVN